MKAAWVIGSAVVLAIGATLTVGQVGRSAVPSLDAAPAWAGGRPDVALCESFIQQQLPPGAGYRRTDAMRTDGASGTLAEFDQAAGVRVPKSRPPSSGDAIVDESDHLDAVMAELEHDRAVGRPVALRTVGISYMVDRESQQQTCAFRLVDGQMEDAEALRLRAERRADRSSTDAVRASVGLRRPRRPTSHFDCCL